MLKKGDKAPQFALETPKGERHSMDQILARGPVVLALFKISCPVCQLTMPFLERIAKDGSLQMYAISQDDAHDTLRFIKTYGITMPTLLDKEDDGYPVSNALGITHVPSVIVVEPDGAIGHAWDGFSKQDLITLGVRAGVKPFRPGEEVPEWKAG